MTLKDVTILYYSACVEDPKFEQKIRDNILKNCNGIPIVSVTQKPIDFGKNICVGVHDCCYNNEHRQIQIGLREISTRFVMVAEADVLYPPDYFVFNPTEDSVVYRYDNVWVLHFWQPVAIFFYKGRSNGAQVVNRDVWLYMLDERFYGQKEWFQKSDPAIDVGFHKRNVRTMQSWKDTPLITIKTLQGISKRTTTIKRIPGEPTLPYWGSAENIKMELTKDNLPDMDRDKGCVV